MPPAAGSGTSSRSSSDARWRRSRNCAMALGHLSHRRVDRMQRALRTSLAQERRAGPGSQAYLERCLDEPRSDEEWLVARDLYERKFQKKRTSTLTDTIVAADVVDIDESKSGSPERAVIELFRVERKTGVPHGEPAMAHPVRIALSGTNSLSTMTARCIRRSSSFLRR